MSETTIFVVTLDNSSGDNFGPVAAYRDHPTEKELERLVWAYECYDSLKEQIDAEGCEGSGAFGSYTFYRVTEVELYDQHTVPSL